MFPSQLTAPLQTRAARHLVFSFASLEYRAWQNFVVADLLIARSEDRTPADPHSKKFITRLACIFTQSIQLSNIILGCLAAWPLLAAMDTSSSSCARMKPLAAQCSVS